MKYLLLLIVILSVLGCKNFNKIQSYNDLEGIWVNIDDSLYIVKFSNKKVTEYYDSKDKDNYNYIISNISCDSSTTTRGEFMIQYRNNLKFCYQIEYNDQFLTLIYLMNPSQRNSFKRIK